VATAVAPLDDRSTLLPRSAASPRSVHRGEHSVWPSSASWLQQRTGPVWHQLGAKDAWKTGYAFNFTAEYSGLSGLVKVGVAMKVDSEGPARLLELTACT
jgi:hypothetical protein